MIHHPDMIVPGQQWSAAGGNGHTVQVSAVHRYGDGPHDVDIHYQWYDQGILKQHNRDSFSFQCRYFNADLDGKGHPTLDELQKQSLRRNQ